MFVCQLVKVERKQKTDESCIITGFIRALNICRGLNRTSCKTKQDLRSSSWWLTGVRLEAGGGWHNSPRWASPAPTPASHWLIKLSVFNSGSPPIVVPSSVVTSLLWHLQEKTLFSNSCFHLSVHPVWGIGTKCLKLPFLACGYSIDTCQLDLQI